MYACSVSGSPGPRRGGFRQVPDEPHGGAAPVGIAAEPDLDARRGRVYATHERDLGVAFGDVGVAFGDVGLVDAQGVDPPQGAGGGGLAAAQPAQGGGEVGRHAQSAAGDQGVGAARCPRIAPRV